MSSEDLEKHVKQMVVGARFLRFEEHTMTVAATVDRFGCQLWKNSQSVRFVDNLGLSVDILPVIIKTPRFQGRANSFNYILITYVSN